MLAAALLAAALVQTPSAKGDVWSEVRAQLGALRKGADPAEVLRELRRHAVLTRKDPLEARKLARRFVRDDAALQRAVICAIAGTAADEVSTEQILEPAESDRAPLRETAIWILALRGVESEAAERSLESALQDPDPGVRRTAAWAFGTLAPGDPLPGLDLVPGQDAAAPRSGKFGMKVEWITPRTLLLESGKPLERGPGRNTERRWRIAVEWIDEPFFVTGPVDPATIPERLAARAPALMRLLADEDDSVSRTALWALGPAAPLVAQEIPRLLTWVRSPDDPRRQGASYIVASMGPPAQVAAEELRNLLGHEDGWVRGVAIAALKNADLPLREERLLAEMGSFTVAAGAAMELLASRDPPAPAALEPLGEHLLAGGYIAAGALARYGERAVPILVRALDHELTDVRAVAAIALGRIGPAAGAARSRLAELAEDSDRNLAKVAREAIERIGGG